MSKTNTSNDGTNISNDINNEHVSQDIVPSSYIMQSCLTANKNLNNELLRAKKYGRFLKLTFKWNFLNNVDLYLLEKDCYHITSSNKCGSVHLENCDCCVVISWHIFPSPHDRINKYTEVSAYDMVNSLKLKKEIYEAIISAKGSNVSYVTFDSDAVEDVDRLILIRLQYRVEEYTEREDKKIKISWL